MDLYQYNTSNLLPLDYLTKHKQKAKANDRIVVLPFTSENLGELVQWLYEDDDKVTLKEFVYG